MRHFNADVSRVRGSNSRKKNLALVEAGRRSTPYNLVGVRGWGSETAHYNFYVRL